MSENADDEIPSYKTKRLEILARAREVARQNRLKEREGKKEEHKKELQSVSRLENK